MNDIIQGNRFRTLAKFQYAPPPGCGKRVINAFRPDDYRYMVSTLDTRKLQDGDIIYTHTFFADYLFEHIKNKIILITHNADTPADIEPPDNILMWYTTNVAIKHPRIKSIPIGLENDYWLKDKAERMRRKWDTKKDFKKLLYLNHNISTNPAKRQRPYDVLKGQKWVTVENGVNGYGFDKYLDNIYNHPFVVCPEGNGIDTHRMWECLYMNTIPVCVRNINNQFYTDLPILFVDDWEEVNEIFLFEAYKSMTNKKWNRDMLKFSYWKDAIINSHTILQ